MIGGIKTNQIIFNKEQYEALAERLKKRILLRLLLMVFIAIAQRLAVLRGSNALAQVLLALAFVIVAISFVLALITFFNFLKNKITFKRISKRFKTRLLDSKLEGATHYFKETFYCRILIKLDNQDGGE